MPLDYVKALWRKNKKGLHIIIFIKLGKTFQISTKNPVIFNIWQEVLRKHVLVSDFHKEYKVEKQVGIGNFARVYYAKRSGTDNYYAVKAFTKEDLAEYDKGIEALYNEIKIMRILGKSEHCLNFFEIHETKNSVYMVIENCPGGELLKKMSSKSKHGE